MNGKIEEFIAELNINDYDLENESEVISLLEAIYEAGFRDTIQIPGSERQFALRTLEIVKKTETEIVEYMKNPDIWLKKALESTMGEGDFLVLGIGNFSAVSHCKESWEIYDDQILLRRRMTMVGSMAENLGYMKIYSQHPAVHLCLRIIERESYRIPTNTLKAIFGMTTYAIAKNMCAHKLEPRLSFDAINIMCSSIVMCSGLQDESGDVEYCKAAMTVGGILACMCMNVYGVDRIENCMTSLMPLCGIVQMVCAGFVKTGIIDDIYTMYRRKNTENIMEEWRILLMEEQQNRKQNKLKDERTYRAKEKITDVQRNMMKM